MWLSSTIKMAPLDQHKSLKDNSYPAGVNVWWEKPQFRSSVVMQSSMNVCHLKFILSMMVKVGNIPEVNDTNVIIVTSSSPVLPQTAANQCWLWRTSDSYCVIVGMLRDLFMMRRTSTSGRLSCLVWAQPSSAAAMCRSKRSDTDFFRSLGFPLKKEPSHCLITLSIFSVLVGKRLEVVAVKADDDDMMRHQIIWTMHGLKKTFWIVVFIC